MNSLQDPLSHRSPPLFLLLSKTTFKKHVVLSPGLLGEDLRLLVSRTNKPVEKMCPESRSINTNKIPFKCLSFRSVSGKCEIE